MDLRTHWSEQGVMFARTPSNDSIFSAGAYNLGWFLLRDFHCGREVSVGARLSLLLVHVRQDRREQVVDATTCLPMLPRVKLLQIFRSNWTFGRLLAPIGCFIGLRGSGTLCPAEALAGNSAPTGSVLVQRILFTTTGRH